MARAIVVPNLIIPSRRDGATLVSLIGEKPKTGVEEKYVPIDFRELFGNSNSVEMEIGCGKGKFLMARALENPGTNFLGIDRVVKYMKRRKARSEKQGFSNIRFLKAEARRFLEDAVPPDSVNIFHIYFPDPWPKRRHQKRRTVSEAFLKLLHAKLRPRGLIEIATDDRDYFECMKKTIAATSELWENVRETVNERILGGMMKTNYELKFEAEGRPLFYAELQKR